MNLASKCLLYLSIARTLEKQFNYPSPHLPKVETVKVTAAEGRLLEGVRHFLNECLSREAPGHQARLRKDKQPPSSHLRNLPYSSSDDVVGGGTVFSKVLIQFLKLYFCLCGGGSLVRIGSKCVYLLSHPSEPEVFT